MRILFSLFSCLSFLMATSEPPGIRIFAVDGNCGGKKIKGVVFYTNHAQSVEDALPKPTRKFIKRNITHVIIEYNLLSHTVFDTPHHSPEDFVAGGYFDPEFSLPSDFDEYAPTFEYLFPGEHNGRAVWKMLHPGRLVSWYYGAFQYGFYNSKNIGVDTWLADKARSDKARYFLEDNLDKDRAHRLDPDKNLFGWRGTKIRDADPRFWLDVFKFIIEEGKSDSYNIFKSSVERYIETLEMTTFLSPSIECNEGVLKCVYKPVTPDATDTDSDAYCTDPSMVYRNSLWLERLDGILGKINGAPFVLAVGKEHRFVKGPDGSKIGIHDYFERNFGVGCLTEITADDIQKYLSTPDS